MRVSMPTVEVADEFRRRLRMFHGEKGLATREEVRSWRTDRGEQTDPSLYDETDDKWEQEQSLAWTVE